MHHIHGVVGAISVGIKIPDIVDSTVFLSYSFVRLVQKRMHFRLLLGKSSLNGWIQLQKSTVYSPLILQNMKSSQNMVTMKTLLSVSFLNSNFLNLIISQSWSSLYRDAI